MKRTCIAFVAAAGLAFAYGAAGGSLIAQSSVPEIGFDTNADLLRTLGATGDVEDAARLLTAAIDGLISQQLAAETPLTVPELARILAPLLQVRP